MRPFDDPAARRGDVTHLPLRLAVADDGGVQGAAGAARAAVSQHHAGAFLRAVSPGGLPHRGARRVRIWPALVGHVDLALGRLRVQPPGTGAPRLRADGRAAHRARPGAHHRRAPAHPVLERMLGDGLTNFLFVGRIVPNKRIEDIVRLAEVYKRYIDANYRFIFVGRTDGMPRYYATVRALVAEFDMLPERFVFTGPVPDWELAAYYRTASVYLSLSEHEGFCVPLLEAMAADVPVFAYESSAVADTLGGAGVCWSPKDLEYAAELLGQLAFDPVMRAEGDRRPARAAEGLQRGQARRAPRRRAGDRLS